jgi:arylsulfatase A-like enzyme
MNRRLLLVFALVLAAGIVRLSFLGLARLRPEAGSPGGGGPAAGEVGPPAPTSPPKTPPPGRPFAARPLTLTTATPTAAALRAAVKGKNVVICVLDAARADHFGAYGYPRETTPNFDRLAKESLVFEQHFTEIGQTAPSMASLLTGEYPDTHGLLANSENDTIYLALDPKTFSLEKGLQRAGYTTFFLSSNPAASPSLGVGEDFMERYYRASMPFARESSPVDYLLGLSKKLPAGGKEPGTPFFAYLHLLPPHMPYAAPEEFKAQFKGAQPPDYWESGRGFAQAGDSIPRMAAPASWVDWINDYDASLRWADSFVGKLVERLKQQGLLEQTLLIVTADHGEAFGEHGYTFHIDCPYDEVLHIPLLVRFPGPNRPVGRVHALTQTIDVTPTILEMESLPIPRGEVQGKSLVPLLTGAADRANEFVFSRGGAQSAFFIVRDAHFTLLLYKDAKQRALYDMDTDPWQTRKVISQQADRAAALTRAFGQFAKTQKYPPLNFLDAGYHPPTRNLPTGKMSEETKRRLKSLGYLR